MKPKEANGSRSSRLTDPPTGTMNSLIGRQLTGNIRGLIAKALGTTALAREEDFCLGEHNENFGKRIHVKTSDGLLADDKSGRWRFSMKFLEARNVHRWMEKCCKEWSQGVNQGSKLQLLFSIVSYRITTNHSRRDICDPMPN